MSDQNTYLFYDIETTGRNKCFDQVLQFAAIRTDLALNEQQRYEFQIKLNCDVVPDPEAILIHRIPVEMMQKGATEIEAIKEIHTLLNTPGTISGGYNTLGFDDEVLRFSFHRNLLPPYTHQWANQCGRFDLYPMAQLYYLYHRDTLNWPTKPDGKISLKLEHLNHANQLATGTAHEAMADVEATLSLARLFFQERKTWDYTIGFFNKALELKRRETLNTFLETSYGKYPLALLLGCTGSADFFQYPALNLGQHFHYKNQTLWLRLDKPELLTTTHDSLPKTTWVARIKPAEHFLLPLSGRFKQHLTEERQHITQANLDWLSQNPVLFQEIQHYYRTYKYPEIPHLDVTADLYVNGFLNRNEEMSCAKFHTASLPEKEKICEDFQNPRLKELAIRILGRHYTADLTPSLAKSFHAYSSRINSENPEDALIDWQGKKHLTPTAALTRLNTMRADRSPADIALLDGLAKYLHQQFSLP